MGDRARTTRDVDLATAGDESSATTDLLAAQAVDLGDFFAFAVERTTDPDEGRGGASVRYHVAAELAGRTFDEFVLDVGFDAPSGAGFDLLRGPDLLAFAGIPPVEMPTLAIEVQIAEKVHAFTRTYGEHSLASTRVKDLVDLALIAAEGEPDATRLRLALEDTFRRRATHGLPAALPRPPADWRVAYGRMAREIGLDPDLGAGHAGASGMLDPVLAGEVQSGAWDAASGRWKPWPPTASTR